MRSMTGYGRGEGDNGALKIVVEVKAVNHRYSEITIKQPRLFLALEDKMKKAFLTKVQIKGTETKGKIVIDYYSKDDLDRIYDIINNR